MDQVRALNGVKVGHKIAGGFTAVLLLLAVVAGFGYFGLNRVAERVEKLDTASQMIKQNLEARRHEKNFIIRGDKEYLDRVTAEVQKQRRAAGELAPILSDPADQQRLTQILDSLKAYEEGFDHLAAGVREEKKVEREMREAAQKAQAAAERLQSETLNSAFVQAKERGEVERMASVREDEAALAASMQILWRMRLAAAFYISRKGKAQWDEVQAAGEELGRSLRKWSGGMGGRPELAKPVAELTAAVEEYQEACRKISQLVEKETQADRLMVDAGRKNVKATEETSVEQRRKMTSMIKNSSMVIILGSLLALLMGAAMAILLTRAVTKPLGRVTHSLREGAEELSQASREVSASSQTLAEGSSQQAASLEETAASLEELTAMTKQNADSAQQADSLMSQTQGIVGQAMESMKELTRSMSRITEASDETARIIKTIDEIAFQTNLLALNAAVEAARAGEAGAGFAVVAEEVRNLALRATEAARQTQQIIEGSLQNVREGSDLVKVTDNAFSQVEEGSRKVSGLVGEIAQASREQAQGLGQVSQALSEMDKVTQQVAANAEEGSAASEELSGQAATLLDTVAGLEALVSGNGRNGLRGGRPAALLPGF